MPAGHQSASIDRTATCLLLAGPTAVGKSEVALVLAECLQGEIVSVDSMQVYRGLDIGTAKPSAVDRQRVLHHLLDLLDLTESFDAAQFVRLAQAAIFQIQSRNHLPILCGGTGLYFKALLDGLGSAPASEPSLRAELEATPLPVLLGELAERDTVTYERIDRRNPRRVIRAIEVLRLTGKPFSSQRADWAQSGSSGCVPMRPLFALARSTADLHERINARVDKMFDSGLVAETKRLLEQGLSQNRTASQAIGYWQVIEHLNGLRSLADTIELVKLRSRQFAKRQMTWFRRQPQVRWIHISAGSDPASIAEAVLRSGAIRH